MHGPRGQTFSLLSEYWRAPTNAPIYTSATNPLFSPAISMRLEAGAFAHASRRFYSSSTSTSQAASAVSFAASRRSRLGGQGEGGGMLSLEHFLLRSKSIKLYRDFLRASRNIPNPSARRETVDWLRDEHFEGPNGLKAESDIPRIRELLMAGNVALKRICGPMELAAALNPQHGSFPKLRGVRDV